MSGRLNNAHRIHGLTRAEALHFLLHSKNGQALAAKRSESLDELADLLCSASERVVAKRRAALRAEQAKREGNMDTATILKNIKTMGEHEFTRIITVFAKKQYPELTPERAFSKVFTGDNAVSQAIRTLHGVAKSAPLRKTDETWDADADEREDDEADPLQLLEQLADALRRKRPELSKAHAFTAIYTDPQYAPLAKRERARYRPRA